MKNASDMSTVRLIPDAFESIWVDFELDSLWFTCFYVFDFFNCIFAILIITID